MHATAAVASARPVGRTRNLALMAVWLVFTVNIYWLYWLYQTYKDIRAHAPHVTKITPGKAVGFLFIPLFNIYWFFRVLVDVTGATRRIQQEERLGETPLNPALVITLFIAGIIGNQITGRIHPALLLLTDPLIIVALVLVQRSLNQHWQRHAAGAVPGVAAALPEALPEAPGEPLGRLLGVRGPMRWMPGVAFLGASVLATLVSVYMLPLISGQGLAPAWIAVIALSGDLIATACVIAAFRLMGNDIGAAAAAAGVYAVLRWLTRLGIITVFLSDSAWRVTLQPIMMVYSLAYLFLLLAALSIMLRWIRPTWLALWIGSTAGQLASTLVSQLFFLAYSAVFLGGSGSISFRPMDLVQDVVAAAVFAFAFWGGLQIAPAKDQRTFSASPR